jgi:predicted ester cyclase
MPDDDTLKQNKEVMRQMLEAYNTGDTEIVKKLLHPEIKDRSREIGFEDGLRRAHAIKRVQTEILRHEDAFPDKKFEEDFLVAEGDTVVLRWRFTGTHKGPILGIAPTGKRVHAHGTEVVRIKDGQIVEHVGDEGMNLLNILWQVGKLDKDLLRRIEEGDASLGDQHRTGDYTPR